MRHCWSPLAGRTLLPSRATGQALDENTGMPVATEKTFDTDAGRSRVPSPCPSASTTRDSARESRAEKSSAVAIGARIFIGAMLHTCRHEQMPWLSAIALRRRDREFPDPEACSTSSARSREFLEIYLSATTSPARRESRDANIEMKRWCDGDEALPRSPESECGSRPLDRSHDQ